jgi:erythronate-4-phosphate dehydrogenase
MKIAADENIPFVNQAFSPLGRVVTASGRSFNSEFLSDADMLLVRSITPVNANLLDGTPVRFVGTATIGTDHVDVEYLRKHGIAFASAPGSNSNSVAEYVLVVLLIFAERFKFRLASKTIGVVGVGNVGSKVAHKCASVGMKVLLNDPPLARETRNPVYRPLDEILEQCDIITVHVPLTKDPPDPTVHMLSREFIKRMKPGSILINTSRGSVHDTFALIEAKKSGKLLALYLDVWEKEPSCDLDLLRVADFGTPHICGYSADGKVAGAAMIQHAACDWMKSRAHWKPRKDIVPIAVSRLEVDDCNAHPEDLLRKLTLSVYDIRQDDAKMREMLKQPTPLRGHTFDRLRKEYPVRREFQNTTVAVSPDCHDFVPVLQGVGFVVDELARR